MSPFSWAAPLAGLFLCTLAAAGPRPVPAAEEEVIYEARTARCGIRVESHGRWSTLRLRFSRDDGTQACELSRDETIGVLTEAFKAVLRNPQQGYESLVLGRLVDYAWLRRHLSDTAAADDGWSHAERKPTAGRINAYVERVLARPEILGAMNEAAGLAGYGLKGFSCEKVLVSEAGLPFDAFCGAELTK